MKKTFEDAKLGDPLYIIDGGGGGNETWVPIKSLLLDDVEGFKVNKLTTSPNASIIYSSNKAPQYFLNYSEFLEHYLPILETRLNTKLTIMSKYQKSLTDLKKELEQVREKIKIENEKLL